MSTLTVCEKLVSASIEDQNVCAILYKFIAENGSLYAAVDKNGNILERYRSIKGKGAGAIKSWLHTMLRLSLFEKYEINQPKTDIDLEIFIQVCDSTNEKKLLCYKESDYTSLLNIYPNVKPIPRSQLRSNREVLEMSKSKTVTILFLAAEPTDAGRIRLGEEHREIDLRLRLAKLRNQFQLEHVFAVRPEDLTQAFLDYNPTIVHFAGHGTSEGSICLEDRTGKSLPIKPSALSDLFKAFRSTIRGVILNACYSKEQAKAIAAYVDFVVGIHRSISDKAAIAYSLGLYQGIGAGKSFTESHNLGCIQIGLQGISTESQPELITRRQET